jgi:hypothetical protein
MRYHWGLGVGHVYTHRRQCTDAGVIWPGTDQHFPAGDDLEEGVQPDQTATEMEHVDLGSGTDGSGSNSDDEDWIPSDTDDSLSSDGDQESLQDINEMYGEDNSDDEYEG